MLFKKFLREAAVPALVLICLYLIINQVRQQSSFREELRSVRRDRKALTDSVASIIKRTELRDQALKKLIREDMNIIDTLNQTLSRLNKSSAAIDSRIESTKSAIDRLWTEE